MAARLGTPKVAIFDAELPPGLAFIRSLGRAGVPTVAYSKLPTAAGRFSRFTKDFRVCPASDEIDSFIEWIIDEYKRGEFDLIAPTSDLMTFIAAEINERLGVDISGGVGGSDQLTAICNCLYKNRFSVRLDELGFPVPRWAAPTSVQDAVRMADDLGYPVILKPRTHVALGVYRGDVARDADEVRKFFRAHPVGLGQTAATRHDSDLRYPIVQEMLTDASLDCISVTGCIDRHGKVLAASCSRKGAQWGGNLSVGTVFETCDPPHFFEAAITIVEQLLGTGVFELEILTNYESGQYWAIDLNPRGFGQIALDIGRGQDLPVLWYNSSTGLDRQVRRASWRRPTVWRMGTPFYAGAAVSVVRGPDRLRALRSTLSACMKPSAGSMHAWDDPVPGLAFGLWFLRHLGGLVRPFLEAVENRRPQPAEPRQNHL